MNKLFAIDNDLQEVIVSESQKGIFKVNFIERIKKTENELLYQAVLTLTIISQDPNLDNSIFKGMDKVCQLIYQKHLESRV